MSQHFIIKTDDRLEEKILSAVENNKKKSNNIYFKP